MYVVVSNLPWIESDAEVLNQNLPLGGMNFFPATAENAETIKRYLHALGDHDFPPLGRRTSVGQDRKSTRLNSSHQIISYAVFCLKKKKNKIAITYRYNA